MIKLQLDAGAEYLVGYAKARLARLTAQRLALGVNTLQRWHVLASGEQIHLTSALVGDTIRITAAQTYLVRVTYPFPMYTESLVRSSSVVGVVPNDVATFNNTYEAFIDGVSQGVINGVGVSSPTVPVTGDRMWIVSNFVEIGTAFNGGTTTGFGTPGGFRLWNGAALQPNNPGINATEVPLYTTYLTLINTDSVIAAIASGTMSLGARAAILAGSLDTPLPNGETITIVPVVPMSGAVSLGFYGPTFLADHVQMYGVAKYRYDLPSNSLVFISWVENFQVLTLTDAHPGGNLVVKYGKSVSLSTAAFARAQAVALRAPVSASDKFLKLVRDAAGI